MGTNAAAATSPVHSGSWVRDVTTTPRATVCIHEPTLETRAADQTRAKLRERSGLSDRSTRPEVTVGTGRPPRGPGPPGGGPAPGVARDTVLP